MYQNNAPGLKCRKDELPFYTAFFILSFYRIIKSSAISFNDHSITYVVIISLLLVRIIKMHVRVNNFLTVCVLCPMFVLCLINTWDPLVPVGNQMLSVWITPLLFVPFCRVDKYLGGGYIEDC